MNILELKLPASYKKGWSAGYPESELESIKKLEGGTLIENDEEIYLVNTEGVKYGFKKKGYLIERTKERLLYHTPGSIKLWKYLLEDGIFEIEDRVGHFCKIQANSIYKDVSFNLHILYLIEFSESQLTLFCNGLFQDFINQRLAENVWIKNINENRYSLLFQSVYSIQMELNRMANNGTLQKGSRTEEWIGISNVFNKAKEIRGIDMEEFETYGKFYYNHYL